MASDADLNDACIKTEPIDADYAEKSTNFAVELRAAAADDGDGDDQKFDSNCRENCGERLLPAIRGESRLRPRILSPEDVNQLGFLDSTSEAFYEWTPTPDPTARSVCAVLIEQQRTQSGESDDDLSLLPAVRIYVCDACGNVYLTCNDLYKHYARCEDGEGGDGGESKGGEDGSKAMGNGEQGNVSKAITSDALRYSFDPDNKEKSNLAHRYKNGLQTCPCCSVLGPKPFIDDHVLNEICSGKLRCKDCTHMFRMQNKLMYYSVPDLHTVHTVEDGDGRCVKACPYCTFSEPSSLIEFDDHLLTHPLCVLCFRVLQTELGLRRHLMGTHKIDTVELMSDSPKYFGGHSASIPATIEQRLLMMKRLFAMGKDGAFDSQDRFYRCEKCEAKFDSIEALRQHSASADVCKECHVTVTRSSSLEHTKKPSILKRKPVQTFCSDCLDNQKRQKIG